MAPTSILASIEDKYSSECLYAGGGIERDPDYGFIVYVSSSPECKKGMYPPIMTFVDYDINKVGESRVA